MEDKIFDDEDIIDLTDLLEEGQPPGEREEPGDQKNAAVSMNEPDSFDLGKEISMEYDVSVDEIENGGENLDIDAELSSNEEDALSQGTPDDEDIILLDDKDASLEVEVPEAFSTPVEEEESLSAREFSGEVQFDGSEPSPVETETPVVESDVLEQQQAPFVMDEAPVEEASGVTSLEEEAPFETGQGEEVMQQVSTDELLDEIRQEIPSMIEGVVRPFIGELVKEIIAASRDQLPGIVEKVIREEIDKLKRLDS